MGEYFSYPFKNETNPQMLSHLQQVRQNDPEEFKNLEYGFIPKEQLPDNWENLPDKALRNILSSEAENENTPQHDVQDKIEHEDIEPAQRVQEQQQVAKARFAEYSEKDRKYLSKFKIPSLKDVQQAQTAMKQQANPQAAIQDEQQQEYQEVKQEVDTEEAQRRETMAAAQKFNQDLQKVQKQEQEKNEAMDSIWTTKGLNQRFDKYGNALSEGTAEGMKDVGRGIGQTGMRLAKNLGIISPEAYKAYTKKIQGYRNQNMQDIQKRYNVGSTAPNIGKFIGNTVPYMAIPGVGGGLAAKAAAGAGVGAGIGATSFNKDPNSANWGRAAAGGALGAATPAILGGLGKLARPFTRRGARAALGRTLANLTPEERVNLAKAQKIMHGGQKMTPGEATLNPVQLRRESRLPVNEKAQFAINKQFEARDAAVRKELSNLTDSIFGKEQGTQVKALNDKLLKQALPQNTRKALLKDKNIIKALRDKGASAKKGTLGSYHEARQALQSRLSKLYKNPFPDANTARAMNSLQGSINRINKTLDDITMIPGTKQSQYAAKRMLDQKWVIKNKWISKLKEVGDDTAKVADGKINATPTAIYKKLFKDPDTRAEFLKDIANAGGNVEQAKNAIELTRRIAASPLNKLLGKQTEGMTNFSIQQGMGAAAFTKAVNMVKGRYNKALVKLVTEPQWADDIAKLVKIGNDKDFWSQLPTLISRIQATAAAQEPTEDTSMLRRLPIEQRNRKQTRYLRRRGR